MNSWVRFCISGLVATATHLLVFVGLVEAMDLPAVLASIFAFSAAVLVSYSLNYHWTFKSPGTHQVMLPRFAVVAILGLSLNALIT